MSDNTLGIIDTKTLLEKQCLEKFCMDITLIRQNNRVLEDIKALKSAPESNNTLKSENTLAEQYCSDGIEEER